MREQNMDFLLSPQMQNCKIHKYNTLTHMGTFITVIYKTNLWTITQIFHKEHLGIFEIGNFMLLEKVLDTQT